MPPQQASYFLVRNTTHEEGKIANENSKIRLSKNVKLQHKKRKITPKSIILYVNYLSYLIKRH
jgi:hypothetical protein